MAWQSCCNQLSSSQPSWRRKSLKISLWRKQSASSSSSNLKLPNSDLQIWVRGRRRVQNTTYTFFSTGETRPIKFNLTCETKNLIYMIQCNRCNLQYIGETKRRLKDRFNEHHRTIDNPNNKSKPTTAAEHFLSSPNHTANDMILIPIEKIFSNRDSIRKAREAFLIQKGRKNLSRWSEHPRRNLLILLPLIMLFHYFFTVYLSLVYTVNYFYLFPVITQHAT